MALHLITGYAGTEHITSADQGAYNMGTFGEGEYVLDRGSKFEATVVSNNLITLADGEALMQGRFIKMISGTTEEVPIENGTQEMNRNDLICIRYEKNSTTSIESASIVVKKGTETSGTPADPEYVTGEITDGNDLVNEMPLYRVTLEGLNIANVTELFLIKGTNAKGFDYEEIALTGNYILSNKSSSTSFEAIEPANDIVKKYRGLWIYVSGPFASTDVNAFKNKRCFGERIILLPKDFKEFILETNSVDFCQNAQFFKLQNSLSSSPVSNSFYYYMKNILNLSLYKANNKLYLNSSHYYFEERSTSVNNFYVFATSWPTTNPNLKMFVHLFGIL